MMEVDSFCFIGSRGSGRGRWELRGGAKGMGEVDVRGIREARITSTGA